jgi:hypothetical protein
MPKNFKNRALTTDDGHVAAIINPGTEPVRRSSVDEAVANMPQLLADCGVPDLRFERTKGDHDGRYCFTVTDPAGNEADVDMPGVPLADARYCNLAGENIWDFPRLYVNGSSWVWYYAVSQLRVTFMGEDEDWEWDGQTELVN